jgi:hypothetical protein
MTTYVNSYKSVDWGNVSNMGDLVSRANESAGGNLWSAILILIFLTLFITLTTIVGSWEVAILVSAFIGLIAGVFLLYMGLTSLTIVGIFIGIIVAMIMYIMWSNRYD